MLKKIFCSMIVIFLMISTMAGCAPKKRGTFYTLQEAYDQGLLTKDDLKSIAYYQNGGSDDESFEPLPKNPEVLNTKTEKAIKETRAYDLRSQRSNPIKDAKIDDVTIVKYYGTYNNFVTVMIRDSHHEHDTAIWEIEIEDVLFHYGDGNRIIVWKGI